MVVNNVKNACFCVMSVHERHNTIFSETCRSFDSVIDAVEQFINNAGMNNGWVHRIFWLDLAMGGISFVTPWLTLGQLNDWLSSNDCDEAKLNAERMIEQVNLR